MSDRNVVLVCPRVPPSRDGVGDYTYCLASELSRHCRVTVATTAGQPAVSGCFRLVTVPDWSMRGLAGLWPILEEIRPSFINVQWVPFLWGRWGVNFALPLTVLRLRRAGYRVVTTVHEPYVPFDMWRRIPMAIIQRLELALLIIGSAKVAVTFSFLKRLFARRFVWRRRDFFWLPVGSNIPQLSQSPTERAETRRANGIGDDDLVVVMFHPFGTGKMPALAFRAWEAIRQHHASARLLLIGCERRQLGDAAPSGDVICTGYVDAATVSRLLSAADMCLAPYVDGMSARRGSTMAAMEHGLPIVSTRGRLTDREVFDQSPVLMPDVKDESAFVRQALRLASDASERRAVAPATASFYQAHFSWPLIAHSLLQECL